MMRIYASKASLDELLKEDVAGHEKLKAARELIVDAGREILDENYESTVFNAKL